MGKSLDYLNATLVMLLMCSFAYLGTHDDNKLGATITTINGSDTITASRSVINTNFSNLNTDKFELSAWYATTSAKQITKLESLAWIGTITTGVWNGTLIGVPYGGTGWAAIQANTIPYGNGTSRLSTTTSGTNGQVLSLSGGVPTWVSTSTQSVDQTANYSWSGTHAFTNTVNIAASSGFKLTLNTLSYYFQSTRQASSTVLTEDGTGQLRWIKPQSYVLTAAAPNSGTSNTSTSSLATIKIPANTIDSLGQITIEAVWEGTQNADSCGLQFDYGTGSATSTMFYYGFPTQANARSTITIKPVTTSSQVITGLFIRSTQQTPSSALVTGVNNTHTLDYTATTYFSLAARSVAGTTACNIQQYVVTVNNL